jgi:Tol biopolymer transport system component
MLSGRHAVSFISVFLNPRAVFLFVLTLTTGISMVLLAGCGSGSYTSPPGPVVTLPVTSGARLLFDTYGVADNAFTSGMNTIAPDGSNFQRIVNDRGASMPHFSADGNKIVYEAGSGTSSLIVSNADGFNGIAILSSGDASYPAFRPDGKAVVFVSNANALCTVNSDGSSLRTLYTAPSGYSLSHPIYTSDASRIFFEQDPNPEINDTPKLHVLYISKPLNGIIGPDYAITPALSPDSSRLAYCGYTDSSHSTLSLFIRTIGGELGQVIGPIASAASHPVFSPDGTKIAYLKLVDSSAFINSSPTYEIHIVNIDGTGDTRVGTKLAVGTYSLDWR